MTTSDLNDLRDLVEPTAPSWLPMAPGLVWLIIVVLWVLLCIAALGFIRYRANAYRRAGLTLLAEATTCHELSVVLKRVALAAYPREQVASLYGEEWVEFLEQSCDGVKLNNLTKANEKNIDTTLRKQAAIWIRRHRC